MSPPKLPEGASRDARSEKWEDVFWDNQAGRRGVDQRLTPHPGCRARRFVADFVRRALDAFDRRLESTEAPDDDSVVDRRGLPPPTFGAVDAEDDAADVDEAAPCAPASARSFSTLKNETGAPWDPPDGDSTYRKGWRFGEDVPGKARGWLSDASARDPPWIAFPVDLVRGLVSVTYLETYENAGLLELWVGAKPGASEAVEGVVRSSASDHSPYKAQPTVRGAPTSYFATPSFVLDTYAPNRTTSEYKTKTIDFGSHGSHLLHVRHVRPKSKLDLERRRGDKVKLLGVVSC